MTRSVLCQLAAKADACRYRMAVEPRSVRERAWWLWAQTYRLSGKFVDMLRIAVHCLASKSVLPRVRECPAAMRLVIDIGPSSTFSAA